jgi:hypothetical protein
MYTQQVYISCSPCRANSTPFTFTVPSVNINIIYTGVALASETKRYIVESSTKPQKGTAATNKPPTQTTTEKGWAGGKLADLCCPRRATTEQRPTKATPEPYIHQALTQLNPTLRPLSARGSLHKCHKWLIYTGVALASETHPYYNNCRKATYHMCGHKLPQATLVTDTVTTPNNQARSRPAQAQTAIHPTRMLQTARLKSCNQCKSQVSTTADPACRP